MNLCGRSPYQKGTAHKKSKRASSAQKRHWERIRLLGCVVGPRGCAGRITIHHIETGAGGRKNHDRVIPLCSEHHMGRSGVDGRVLSKIQWQAIHGSEQELLEKVVLLLNDN